MLASPVSYQLEKPSPAGSIGRYNWLAGISFIETLLAGSMNEFLVTRWPECQLGNTWTSYLAHVHNTDASRHMLSRARIIWEHINNRSCDMHVIPLI